MWSYDRVYLQLQGKACEVVNTLGTQEQCFVINGGWVSLSEERLKFETTVHSWKQLQVVFISRNKISQKQTPKLMNYHVQEGKYINW